MFKKLPPLLALALPALLTQPVVSAEGLPPASHWMPQEAVMVLEISQPGALLDSLLSQELADAITALPGYREQAATPKFRMFQGIIGTLETQLGTDWKTGLRKLAGGGLTFAVGPGGGTLLSVDAQDQKMLEQFNEVISRLANGGATGKNQPDLVASREYRGATVWSLGTNEAHVVLGNRLLMANRSHVLDYALDLRAEPNGRDLASSPSYQAAREAVGRDAVATALVSVPALMKNLKVKAALGRNDDPLWALLLADLGDALSRANWLALGLYLKDGKLRLKAVTDSPPREAVALKSFATPRASDEGLLPNLSVPGGIAGLSLYRDLHGFYAAKDDLFPERTSGLVFFENMMGIFFSGMELNGQVLAEASPEIRVMVAAQQYDPAIGTPSVQIPAFAAVLRLRHPETFGEVVEEAWQKALGLSNFTRGQKALPGLIIDRAAHGDVKYTYSYYRPPNDKDKVTIDPRYNYRPSLARPGDYLIVSSTDTLARDLIDALKKESANPVKAVSTAHSLMEVSGESLRGILWANREPLIRQNMVDKGHSREQAEFEVGNLFAILDCVDRASLRVGPEVGHPQADLELQFKAPGTKRVRTASLEPSR